MRDNNFFWRKKQMDLEEFKQKYEEELKQPEKIITDFMEKLGDWLSEMIKIAFVEGYHVPRHYLTPEEWEAEYGEPLRKDALVWLTCQPYEDRGWTKWEINYYHVCKSYLSPHKILVANGPYPPPEDYHG
jgi:hypothetical protein